MDLHTTLDTNYNYVGISSMQSSGPVYNTALTRTLLIKYKYLCTFVKMDRNGEKEGKGENMVSKKKNE